MTKKLILEVRVNEYMSRAGNSNIPWTPEEIAQDAAACAAAGATAIHFHARTPSGAPDLSYETYRDIVSLIRRDTDLLINPTLGVGLQDPDPLTRLSNIVRLTEEGLRPDFVPVDLGSMNTDYINEDATGFLSENKVYVNSTETLKYFARTLRDLGIKPFFQAWNIPHMWLAEIFSRTGLVDGPVWMGLAHNLGSSDAHPGVMSHPGTPAGLNAFLSLMPENMPVEWDVMTHGSILELAPTIIERGGHISLGLGDYPYRELGEPTNAEVIAHIVDLARKLGREVATPQEAKEILAIEA